MTSILHEVLVQLIPLAILGFFIWAVITISKQLDSIAALLRVLLAEIRNRLPASQTD